MAASNFGNLKVVYRISENSYKKERLNISKERSLENARKTFKNAEFYVIADNVSDEFAEKIQPNERTKLGNAGSFRRAWEIAKAHSGYTYLLEDDYWHKEGAEAAVKDAIALNLGLFTLYDHPDKYMEFYRGLKSEVYVGNFCHWRTTPSTTMTFLVHSDIANQKIVDGVVKRHTTGQHPQDHQMFLELAMVGYTLYSSIPGYSSHLEKAYLSPLYNWYEHE